MAPVPPNKEFHGGPRPLHTARRIRRVRRLINSGASNRQITRAVRRASTTINAAQRQGTFGRQSQRQARRTVRKLKHSKNFYGRQGARVIRRSVRPRRPSRPIKVTVGRGLNRRNQSDIQDYPYKSPYELKKKKKQVRKRNHVNRPAPHVNKPRHPGRPSRPGHPKRHHNPPKVKRNQGPRKQGPPKKKSYKPVKLGPAGKKLSRRITNVTENRYLRASDKQINKRVAEFRKRRKYIVKHTKGKKKEQKKIKIARKNLMKDVRERGAGAPKLYRRAGLAVSAELDPQLKGLRSRIRQERRTGLRTRKDIRGLYNTAIEQHGENRQRMNESADQSVERSNNAYDSLISKLADDYGTTKQGVQDELSRLNINAAGPAATEGLTRDEQYSKSQAQLSKTESSQGMRSDQEAAGQLMALLGGEMKASQTQGITTARQTTADEITALRDQLSALAATRLGKISTAVEALRASRSAARSQRIQDQLAMAMANRNFRLDKAGLKLDMAKFQQDTRNDRFQHRLDRDKLRLDAMEFFSGKRADRKLKPAGQYSNSRAGAVDYLRDRKAGKTVIDRYLSFVESASHATHIKGPLGIPILVPKNLARNDNSKVNFMVKQLIKKGMRPSQAKGFGDALRIEWGLV